MTARTYLSVTDTAKMLRQALKAAWPGVKFSVRSSKYAGGASIDVSWTDGPTETDVERVTSLYSGASFDGMQDLKTYHDSVIVDEDGQPQVVHFGADFIFTHRSPSPELVAAAASFVAARGWTGVSRDRLQCRYCADWQPAGFDRWHVARERDGFRVFCCTAECAARVEIRWGHIRPGTRKVTT